MLAALVVPYGFVGAQSNTGCTREINAAVWKPFVTHLVSGNKKSFAALHSSNITRVEIDRDRVQDFAQYFPAPLENDSLDDNRKMNLNYALIKEFVTATVPGKPVTTRAQLCRRENPPGVTTVDLWWCYKKKAEPGKYL